MKQEQLRKESVGDGVEDASQGEESHKPRQGDVPGPNVIRCLAHCDCCDQRLTVT